MLHLFTLGTERLDGVKHGYFNVAVANDYPEEARLFPVEVRLVLFCPLHLFRHPALFYYLGDFRKPSVVFGFQGFGTDVPDGTDVAPAPFEQPYHVAPQPVILRLVAVASRYLV